jgi:pilus assembly protein CpaB
MPLRLIVVALMLAGATALALIAYQIAQPPRVVITDAAQPQAVVPLTYGYITAAHALPAGTLARDEDFTIKRVARDKVPSGALEDTPEMRGSLRGALIRRYLESGVPVTEGDVLRPRDHGFLAAVLEPGTRAISIAVDPVSGVAGLIWPGDRVDVLLTQEMEGAAVARRILTETVLSDIRVIAVDQEIVQGASPTSAVAGKLARTVTVQVTADQTEKLTVAERLGKINLAIRAAAEDPASQPGRLTVFGGDVSRALSQITPPVGVRMQVIEGDKQREVTFH